MHGKTIVYAADRKGESSMDHKTVVFNEAKMNFDGNLDFSVLSPEVVTYSDTTPDQFAIAFFILYLNLNSRSF